MRTLTPCAAVSHLSSVTVRLLKPSSAFLEELLLSWEMRGGDFHSQRVARVRGAEGINYRPCMITGAVSQMASGQGAKTLKAAIISNTPL